MWIWLRKWGFFLLVCWWGGAAVGLAQFDTDKERKKKAKLARQVKCISKCYTKGRKRFYRCRSKRATICNMKAGIHLRACIYRCQAPWFCKGFLRTSKHCFKRCVVNAWKKRPKKRWSRKKKRWVRPSRRMLKRWLARTNFSCKQVCIQLHKACDAPKIPTLPRPVKLPDLEKL